MKAIYVQLFPGGVKVPLFNILVDVNIGYYLCLETI